MNIDNFDKTDGNFDRKLPSLYMGFTNVLVKNVKNVKHIHYRITPRWLWPNFLLRYKYQPPSGHRPPQLYFFDIFDKNISKTHIK